MRIKEHLGPCTYVKNGLTRRMICNQCRKSEPSPKGLDIYKQSIFILLKLENLPMRQISKILSVNANTLVYWWSKYQGHSVMNINRPGQKRLRGWLPADTSIYVQNEKGNKNKKLFNQENEFWIELVENDEEGKFFSRVPEIKRSYHEKLKEIRTIELFLFGLDAKEIKNLFRYDSIKAVEQVLNQPLSEVMPLRRPKIAENQLPQRPLDSSLKKFILKMNSDRHSNADAPITVIGKIIMTSPVAKI